MMHHITLITLCVAAVAGILTLIAAARAESTGAGSPFEHWQAARYVRRLARQRRLAIYRARPGHNPFDAESVADARAIGGVRWAPTAAEVAAEARQPLRVSGDDGVDWADGLMDVDLSALADVAGDDFDDEDWATQA